MKIGRKLKTLRLKHNLTMEELGKRCDLSKGFISQLEHDVSSPSIEKLKSILDIFDCPLSTFFAGEVKEKIVFKSQDVTVSDEEDYQIKWIIPNAQKLTLEPVILTLKPFGNSNKIPPFQGQIFGYVLSGTVFVHYGATRVKAVANEAFYIKGNEKHYLENPNNSIATILWVSNPPIF
ncbi:XRE family transcriptional regulator [Spiroplasma endosymbiont of Monopis laevigella]|uniref:helix-turn-helix domain-containing protein n=1 Tax=Spiroplasma endosymbiont of Monopis laevigella TaxID=3066312 RepID=UPI0030D46D5F